MTKAEAKLYPAQAALEKADKDGLRETDPKKYKEIYDKAEKENRLMKGFYGYGPRTDAEFIAKRKKTLGW